MATISLKTAQKHLDAWLEAEMAVTNAQSYTIGSRTLTKANLTEIRNSIEYWAGKWHSWKICRKMVEETG